MTETSRKTDGLKRVLDFLSFLNSKGIQYHIVQQSPDALMVTFALLTVRIEVEFGVDGMEFSYFRGTEDVETDLAVLHDLIAKHWDD